jgi:hypothetical protein
MRRSTSGHPSAGGRRPQSELPKHSAGKAGQVQGQGQGKHPSHSHVKGSKRPRQQLHTEEAEEEFTVDPLSSKEADEDHSAGSKSNGGRSTGRELELQEEIRRIEMEEGKEEHEMDDWQKLRSKIKRQSRHD